MRTVLMGLVWICGVASAGAQSDVAIEVATDRDFYREGAVTEVYVQARVRAAAPTTDAAAAVRNVALVLDRSGSMAGERMQHLRQGVAAAMDLLSDRDTCAVVTFGSEVETLLAAQRKVEIKDLGSLLAQIEPEGGSALYDALNQGAAQLRRYATPTSINHLVLVTDGPPTKGPREFDDFVRLVDVFSREGITLSTIGVGEEFDEDLLAALARIGGGQFRYAAQPTALAGMLPAEIMPLQTVVAHDVRLAIEFRPFLRELNSHGWEPATISDDAVVFRFPHVFAGQDLAVLASGQISALGASGARRDAITVRLNWRGANDGQPHELVQTLTLRFISDETAVRESANASVFRTAASTLISEAMQEAIEGLDKGDFRAAVRALRRARNEARELNYNLQDEEITATIRRLDEYLADVQARGLNQLDRKILRSGLFNQFESPTADDDKKR